MDSPSCLIEAVAVISRHAPGITSNSRRFSEPRPKALTEDAFFSFQASDPRLTGRAHVGILDKKLLAVFERHSG